MKSHTIVFLDESGFRLLPLVVRTWALRGQTPILRVRLKWAHLSVMGAITHEGPLLTWIQKQAFGQLTLCNS
jgi:DDE superfamily endonuclease